MTGAELKTIRHKLGLSAYALGRALGYQGKRNTVQVRMRRLESDAEPIPPTIARCAYMLGWHGVPSRWPDEDETPADDAARPRHHPTLRITTASSGRRRITRRGTTCCR